MKNYREALIIDDDVDLCTTLKTVLSPTIQTVNTANTLQDGMTMLQQTKPQVIFLDNNLPDGHGVDIIKDIKAQSPATYIIFITAADSARADAIYKGVDVFLEKPLTYSSILGALTQLEQIQQQL